MDRRVALFFFIGTEIISQKAPAVFVFVAIDAEVLPIVPVGRVVVMVVVLVMDRELA